MRLLAGSGPRRLGLGAVLLALILALALIIIDPDETAALPRNAIRVEVGGARSGFYPAGPCRGADRVTGDPRRR
jgi:hypothetical protein